VEYRTERDSMGEVQLPADALYGASTQRAVDNFPISGWRFPRHFLWAMGLIKGAAARAAGAAGYLDDGVASAVSTAADEVMEGRWDEQFPLDIFQTGSGTSTNINANEVIARRASQLLKGSNVHPNDHVNFGQSSNDAIPSAIHVAAGRSIRVDLVPAMDHLARSLRRKAAEFDHVIKSGRTHLMDATPVRLGQEFAGYASQIEKGMKRLEKVLPDLDELALGGTAVGTGINSPTGLAAATIGLMSEATGYPYTEAADHFEAQGGKDAIVMASGALKTIAVSLFKIANDLRWLGSGPTSGIGEIHLPDVQPGSSIMPGKVNPVMAEMAMQVAVQVVGADAAVTWGAANGNFELNVMMPVIAHNLLSSIGLLAAACENLAVKCVEGITANEARARELVEKNAIVVTALNPYIGYENGAKVVKEADRTGKSVREIIIEMGLLDADQLDKVLDLRRITEGGLLGD